MSKRAGVTKKVSLSVHVDDLAILQQRAKRLHGGNVSAVFADLIAQIRRQESWRKALAWYGEPLDTSPEERDAIDRELLGEPPARRRRARGARR